MKFKTKIVSTLITAAALFILSAPVIAGNGHGPGDGTGTGDGDCTGDGPGTGDCQDMILINGDTILLANGGYGPGDGTGTGEGSEDGEGNGPATGDCDNA